MSPAEVDELCRLAREVWRRHYPPIIGHDQTEYMLAQRYDPAVIHAELDCETIWWDVLRIGGAMRAFASSFPDECPRVLKLDKLYVHPDFQRSGLGASLVAHVCERAADSGYDRICLAVNKRNETAIRAYRKYGFAIVRSVVKEIGGGFIMDDYVMEKVLIRNAQAGQAA
jgi:GNAT superfamily N-acetyltransferase